MPKAKNQMTKTEVLQFRVTPSQKIRLDDKKGTVSTTDALTAALNLYLSDDNNLLQQIANGVEINIKSEDEYQQLKLLLGISQFLYEKFLKFENENPELKTNVWKNVFRDFLIPSLEKPIINYEQTHHIKQNTVIDLD